MPREAKESDDYLDRLYKLLPAEVTGAYLGVRILIAPESNTNEKYLLFFAVIILIASPIVYYKVMAVTSSVQIAFLTFSYVVWAANIDIQRIATLKTEKFADNPFMAFILDPTFIKGWLVVWVLMLVPLVLGKQKAR